VFDLRRGEEKPPLKEDSARRLVPALPGEQTTHRRWLWSGGVPQEDRTKNLSKQAPTTEARQKLSVRPPVVKMCLGDEERVWAVELHRVKEMG